MNVNGKIRRESGGPTPGYSFSCFSGERCIRNWLQNLVRSGWLASSFQLWALRYALCALHFACIWIGPPFSWMTPDLNFSSLTLKPSHPISFTISYQLNCFVQCQGLTPNLLNCWFLLLIKIFNQKEICIDSPTGKYRMAHSLVMRKS